MVTASVHPVILAVDAELASARKAHASMNSRHEAYAVIAKELDEFWDEVKLNPKKMTGLSCQLWGDRMRKELIQVAAMAVRTIIDLGLEGE